MDMEMARESADLLLKYGRDDEWPFRSRAMALVNHLFGVPYGGNGILGVATGPMTIYPGYFNDHDLSPHPDPAIRKLAESLCGAADKDFPTFQDKAIELAWLVLAFDKEQEIKRRNTGGQ